MAANKQHILSELRKAKSAHIRWRSYAYGMVSGLDVTDEYTPLASTDCAFGKWYYSEGKAHFGQMDTFNGIEVPHKILHEIYKKIHALVKAGKMEDAQKQAGNLTELSRQLLEAVELLEREAEKMPA